MKYLTISEVSKVLNVSEKTLRIWEEKGKLIPDERTEGGHRRYSSNKVCDFIRKEGVIKGELLDEYSSVFIDIADVEYDMNSKKRTDEKIVDFMVEKGFLKKDSDVYNINNRTMASLIDSYLRYSKFCENTLGEAGDFDDSYWIAILIKFWEKFVAKNVVGVQPMTGPAGLIFYMHEDMERNVMTIESDVVAAKTRLLSSKFVCNKRYGISFDDGVEINATNLANEISDSIMKIILSMTSENTNIDWKDNLYQIMSENKFNAIVTNEVGLSLLRNKFFMNLPAVKDRMAMQDMGSKYIQDSKGSDNNVKIDVYYHPEVDKLLLVNCNSKESIIKAGLFFCPYIITPHGTGLNQIMFRGNTKTIGNSAKHYMQVSF